MIAALLGKFRSIALYRLMNLVELGISIPLNLSDDLICKKIIDDCVCP